MSKYIHAHVNDDKHSTSVGDKNRCCPVCVKFYLNRCRFAAVIAKCLGGSLFWDTVCIF